MTTRTTTPPYRAYATIAGTFVGGLAAAGALARALDRDPRGHDALDFGVLGLATFKASRTISRDHVASFLREPFVAPRFGRILTWSLAAAGLNDWLQAGFASLAHKANTLD